MSTLKQMAAQWARLLACPACNLTLQGYLAHKKTPTRLGPP